MQLQQRGGKGQVGLRLSQGFRRRVRRCSAPRTYARIAARTDKLEIQTIDGAPVKESGLEGALREAGFGTSPKGVVLWPERRPVLA